jgi:hypothetical protein
MQVAALTSRAPVPVHFLSYTAPTFKKSQIPPHTSAHKHGKKKDISVSCNEGEHHEPHYVMILNEMQFTPLLTQRKLLMNLKQSVTKH